MAVCCPEGSIGAAQFTDNTEPNGTIETMEKNTIEQAMKMYITGVPLSQTKRIVIVFSDVYGYDSGRHFQFADELSNKLSSTTVVVPDIFRGSPCMQPWTMFGEKLGSLLGAPAMLYRAKYWYNTFYIMSALTNLIHPWLIEKSNSNVKISSVGFCFGGWVIAKSISQGFQMECAVSCHPAFNLEQIHGNSEDSLAEGVGATPYFLMPAGNDSEKIKVGGSALAIMARNRNVKDENRISCEFKDMKHGWVTRGDPADTSIATAQNKAMKKCVAFIKQYHSIEESKM